VAFILGEGRGTILISAKDYKGQIYMHTPLTGGKFYEYDGKDWLNSDNETLIHRLAADMHQLVNDFPNGGEALQTFYDDMMAEEKRVFDIQDKKEKNPLHAKLFAKRVPGQAPPRRVFD
jgi:predicted metal-dependent enzyme (double-stranded beta helix superfamily)